MFGLGPHYTQSLSNRCALFPWSPPQHYAAKALENVFGLGGPWAHQLATAETMGHLLHVRLLGAQSLTGSLLLRSDSLFQLLCHPWSCLKMPVDACATM